MRTLLLGFLLSGIVAQGQTPPASPPLIRENATVKVSDHVYVIPDNSVGLVPNVGIIVGSRATLVVDTGLGPRNGQTILKEVAKVSKNAELYVVSTHFHPEHALGEAAFPATAKVLRAKAQQQDIDEFGLTTANAFAGRSEINAEFLKDVTFRKAAEIFDRERTLDLGGVRVRIFWLNSTHTRGDTLIHVQGDNVLFAGDVVMNRRFLSFASPYASLSGWLNSLDQLEQLNSKTIVPSNGAVGDAKLIAEQREYLKALQTRTASLKMQGKSADEAVQTVTSEIQMRFSNWTNPNAIGPAARTAFAEAK